jgi:hypothetical protein
MQMDLGRLVCFGGVCLIKSLFLWFDLCKWLILRMGSPGASISTPDVSTMLCMSRKVGKGVTSV